MPYIADFHIHSKYSRATSQEMDLEHLNKWMKYKGISILGTGDFTHPLWFKELREKLEPSGNGLLKLKVLNNYSTLLSQTKLKNPTSLLGPATYFVLTSEISCIYSKRAKTYRIHLLILAPDFETVEKINTHLSWIGNLKADGRPILGLDAKEAIKIILDASPDSVVIPAHIWTPWFSLFGSKSGFDSVEECFEEMTPYIYAIETGLSASPEMCWRVSKLDRIIITSNSDAHSPANLGREANVFEGEEPSYASIVEAIKKQGQGDRLKLSYTIEFFPQEGKYHFDGHRNCGITFSPEETKKHQGICPKCSRPVTRGVMHRVEDLADRSCGEKPTRTLPYKSLVPLQEIIAEALAQGKNTKLVQKTYEQLVRQAGSEFNVLLNLNYEELQNITSARIIEGIRRVREGRLIIIPGYDGLYGQVKIFNEEEKKELGKIGQARLF